MHSLTTAFATEVADRLRTLDAEAASGRFDRAIAIMVETFARGGVLHAFGTGHSEAFAMEIAGRAGGFIPTHHMMLKDLFLIGSRKSVSEIGGAELERDDSVADELYDLYDIRADDAFIIASNSGANGSTVGLARRARAEGLPVIAVTSLEHSKGVTSKHPSGKRLFEVADVVIDNHAPYGDATLELTDGLKVGPVSSLTAAYIAQLLTIETAAQLQERGTLPPMFISANIPGGDEHNHDLQERYGARIRPHAYLK
ncbi:SIS domain-containing protein [Tessaracoccus sp. OS52]|uniref:sugar isomerase domain-containing protein n=1 Tax=Tessaracoccus sp. OS52 TaxID=2886691 RepID=UPI001D124D12|nr:SIS domain-containing protein [Tessaracoccus sp. OS52]MCC2592707.1 SIS domain-containing protein [Tessaracoccus sp. OS52]